MGLESINFIFRSEEPMKNIIEDNHQIERFDEARYVYAEEKLFWIDIKLQKEYCISIRIALSNPIDSVLKALDNLLLYLFGSTGGMLTNLNTKEEYGDYDEHTEKRIIDTYKDRHKVFEGIYGDYTSTIGSDAFYQIQRAKDEY